MPLEPEVTLSRRERQIMDVVYRRGRATVKEVLNDLPDPPSYSAVRALMRILEEKGHLQHEREKAKYVYKPIRTRRAAAKLAIRRVVQTFFDNSATKAAAALLSAYEPELNAEELDSLKQMVEQARQKK
jgi:BlaI family transcriptional regulator, penicillinase repressor